VRYYGNPLFTGPKPYAPTGPAPLGIDVDGLVLMFSFGGARVIPLSLSPLSLLSLFPLPDASR
jgi:hypothetical protein